ncbi:short-chain dehydrogenase [Hahella sp. CCB-MM4]|uniref:SDR family oxidoreductase n=1 Tax=Hahella sp. (strain CCB-MM4) TaxID=1926491 RepID=UPI000B9B7483|nr:SDR family oxidoreductase [Hahella sp. CCB-MM4]OZG74168.1 short-chain dehydrogenase [Hahella sp. CCB-MM4]
MLDDLKHKRILVTGATSGIGEAVVRALRDADAQVLAVGRNVEKLTLLREICGCDVLEADLSSPEGTEAISLDSGPLHGAVNCAGLALLQPCLDLTAAAFDRMMSINARAAALVSREVARRMISQGSGGAIVNVSSQAGLIALKDHLGYAASKAAMDAITRNLCAELGPHNIRVNSVNPTVTMTPMAKVGWSDPEKADALRNQIPMRRFAEPGEVVMPILFLLSDAAAMISGATIPIDGGYTAV